MLHTSEDGKFLQMLASRSESTGIQKGNLPRLELVAAARSGTSGRTSDAVENSHDGETLLYLDFLRRDEEGIRRVMEVWLHCL